MWNDHKMLWFRHNILWSSRLLESRLIISQRQREWLAVGAEREANGGAERKAAGDAQPARPAGRSDAGHLRLKLAHLLTAVV